MEWEVEYTNEFEAWWDSLLEIEQDAIVAAVGLLQNKGPALGRPLVDGIKSSKFANMKELRPMASHVRVLFAFDPRRCAVLLLGGDKTNNWNTWYDETVPKADLLYQEHLDTLRAEGVIP